MKCEETSGPSPTLVPPQINNNGSVEAHDLVKPDPALSPTTMDEHSFEVGSIYSIYLAIYLSRYLVLKPSTYRIIYLFYSYLFI